MVDFSNEYLAGKLEVVLVLLEKNDETHNEILDRISKNDENLSNLFKNGPISKLQQEDVRLDADLKNLKSNIKTSFIVAGVAISPAVGWAVVQILERLL